MEIILGIIIISVVSYYYISLNDSIKELKEKLSSIEEHINTNNK